VNEPVGGRERAVPSDTQTTLGTRSGLRCQLEVHAHHVKSGAPIHAEAGVHRSCFQVQEPGGAWLGPLWPNGGAGFGPVHVGFPYSPHPSPRDYKRGVARSRQERV